jgi:hypothetical protein
VRVLHVVAETRVRPVASRLTRQFYHDGAVLAQLGGADVHQRQAVHHLLPVQLVTVLERGG